MIEIKATLELSTETMKMLSNLADAINKLNNLSPAAQETAKAPIASAEEGFTVAPAAVLPTTKTVSGVPVTPVTLDFDKLAAAAMPILDAQGNKVIYDLLHSFGVDALINLPKEKYNEFADGLRRLGAKI